jgi:hypothetical protein
MRDTKREAAFVRFRDALSNISKKSISLGKSFMVIYMNSLYKRRCDVK